MVRASFVRRAQGDGLACGDGGHQCLERSSPATLALAWRRRRRRAEHEACPPETSALPSLLMMTMGGSSKWAGSIRATSRAVFGRPSTSSWPRSPPMFSGPLAPRCARPGAGDDRPEVLADIQRSKLRKRLATLRRVLAGRVGPHGMSLASEVLAHADYAGESTAAVSGEADAGLLPFAPRWAG